jgi:2,4-dichlorophenol 6-monooxygenase
VEREGERKALRQVAPPGSFTLIAGENGDSWRQAAEAAARARGIDLKALRLGHAEGDWLDPRLTFIRRREFGPEGAILVRPDRVTAWRSMGAAPDAERVIGSALDQVLARN